MTNLRGKIKKAYPDLRGSNWLPQLKQEDREALLYLNLREASQHGRLGGLARAASGKRDEKGRFVK